MNQFNGKTVIITGAAGHLGHATAHAFAAQGAKLALVSRDPVALKSLLQDLGAMADAAIFPTDLLQPQAVSAMVDQVSDHFGQIHVLANLAGGFTMGPPLHETSDADWDKMMDLNARTLFHCVRATVPRLLEFGGGRIITPPRPGRRSRRSRSSS